MEYESLVLCAPCVFVYSGVGFLLVVVGFVLFLFFGSFVVFCFGFWFFWFFLFLLFGQVYKVLCMYLFCFVFWPHRLCAICLHPEPHLSAHCVCGWYRQGEACPGDLSSYCIFPLLERSDLVPRADLVLEPDSV